MKQFKYLIFFVALTAITITVSSYRERNGMAKLKLIFEFTADGKPIIMRDSTYSNPFGELYTISKLKFYISNINLAGNADLKHRADCHLVDANANTGIELDVKPGSYDALQFMLGIDSAKNFSGAQSGALDPINDMFWTWNSGYVVFKMEGKSPTSTADLNRLEYHIGGYKGTNNVSTAIRLVLPSGKILLKEESITELVIKVDADKFWNHSYPLRISETPVCINPGGLAKSISGNFPALFSIAQR